jgi:predicted CxxxxCH...CXXCH cytochrome family protein
MKRALLCCVLSGCFVAREPQGPREDQSCTRCHGDSSREGTALERSAPPFDVFGNTGLDYPGVGAHQRHLAASQTHGAVACTECHRVPQTAQDEGHNVGRTRFDFGPIARGDGGIEPSYDFATRRCLTACHGGASGIWTQARTPAQTCGTCHGVPPPQPHPQAGACEVCHAEVIGDGGIINPALHVDGMVEVSPAACNACHGTSDAGAPPRALDGGTERSSRGVGAHAAHLAGGAQSKPVACASCHLVPSTVVTPTHPNGGPAAVLPGVGWSTTSLTCTTSCHGAAGSPEWNSLNPNLRCTSCHGAPPAAPHPQATNCALCHPNATGAMGRELRDRALHVNGIVETMVPAACDGCHGGGGNPAPPRDTAQQTATTAPGVGAHQAHVVGRGLARPVPCTECHQVPLQVLTATHPNGITEVKFGGVAVSNLAAPNYRQGSCANSACHDISNLTSAPGGGSATSPRWTVVDGSQATCTSCHGLPPPLPHMQRADCESCHTNVTAQRTFRNPAWHVDGQVDFEVP